MYFATGVEVSYKDKKTADIVLEALIKRGYGAHTVENTVYVTSEPPHGTCSSCHHTYITERGHTRCYLTEKAVKDDGTCEKWHKGVYPKLPWGENHDLHYGLWL